MFKVNPQTDNLTKKPFEISSNNGISYLEIASLRSCIRIPITSTLLNRLERGSDFVSFVCLCQLCFRRFYNVITAVSFSRRLHNVHFGRSSGDDDDDDDDDDELFLWYGWPGENCSVLFPARTIVRDPRHR